MSHGGERYDFNKEEDVAKVSARIRVSFEKLAGRVDGGDDCVQEVLCRMLAGKHQHATIDQAVIDYLRANLVNKRVGSHLAKQRFQQPYSYEQGEYDRTIQASDGRDLVDRLDTGRIRKFIGNKEDRIVFNLTTVWGMSEAEIADILGVGPSRVHQRLKRIQSGLSTRAKAKEPRASASGTREVERVLREETKGIEWRLGSFEIGRVEKAESWQVASFNETSF